MSATPRHLYNFFYPYMASLELCIVYVKHRGNEWE